MPSLSINLKCTRSSEVSAAMMVMIIENVKKKLCDSGMLCYYEVSYGVFTIFYYLLIYIQSLEGKKGAKKHLQILLKLFFGESICSFLILLKCKIKFSYFCCTYLHSINFEAHKTTIAIYIYVI